MNDTVKSYVKERVNEINPDVKPSEKSEPSETSEKSEISKSSEHSEAPQQ